MLDLQEYKVICRGLTLFSVKRLHDLGDTRMIEAGKDQSLL